MIFATLIVVEFTNYNIETAIGAIIPNKKYNIFIAKDPDSSVGIKNEKK